MCLCLFSLVSLTVKDDSKIVTETLFVQQEGGEMTKCYFLGDLLP